MIAFQKIRDDIYQLSTPFGIGTTGITLLLGKEPILIDSGADMPETYLLPALRALGLAPSDIAWLAHTHAHGDHITGHHALVTSYGMRPVSYRIAAPALRDPASNAIRIRTKFPEYSPAPQSYLKGVEPVKTLEDGALLADRLRLIATPGHDYDCVSWLDTETGTLITGDSLQANGTPSQGIALYMSLPDYEHTLDKLAKYDISTILPGHDYDGMGALIEGAENAREALAFSKRQSARYHALVAGCLGEGICDPAEIARRLIEAVGCGIPEHLFLSLYTVSEHIRRIHEAES